MFEPNRAQKLSPNRETHFHLIGVCGIGMSALARVLNHFGYSVTGSDVRLESTGETLIQEGIPIFCPQSVSNVKKGQIVVISDAIKEDNPELTEARTLDNQIITRGQLLGQISSWFDRVITVTGTHGKTTTTSLISHMAVMMGLPATCMVGGIFAQWGSNTHIQGTNILIHEGCEAFGNLRYYNPSILVVTNIDMDHLECFDGSFDKLKQSFIEIIHRVVGGNGVVVLNADDSVLFTMKNEFPKSVYWFSHNIAQLDTRIEGICSKIAISENGTEMTCQIKGEKVLLSVPLFGSHNVENVMAALMAVSFVCNPSRAAETLANFQNSKRRFELVGEFQGGVVYNDYAHHPKEISCALKVGRQLAVAAGGKLVAVYQPHLYSRTKLLCRETGTALNASDMVVVLPIYGGREPFELGVNSEQILAAISSPTVGKFVANDWCDAKNILTNIVSKHDVVMLLGAGDIGSNDGKWLVA